MLATNDLESPPERIPAADRVHRHIELFFNWIKQHLQIKRFLGESEGAARTELLTALIADLLMTIAHRTSGASSSLRENLMMLRASLFQREANETSHHQRCRERKRALAKRRGGFFLEVFQTAVLHEDDGR